MTEDLINNDDLEIDFKDILKKLLKNKISIIFISFLTATIFFAYSYFLPNVYKSSAILVVTNQQETQTSSTLSRFSGLAGVAGLNIGQEGSSKKSIAIATIQSFDFFESFNERHNIFLDLVGSKGWNKSNNKIVLHPSSNLKNNTAKKGLFRNKDITMIDAHSVFKDSLSISEDQVSGLITISFSHYSPFFTQKVMANLINDINSEMRNIDISNSNKTLDYLYNEINKTFDSDLKESLYNLVSQEVEKISLAQVTEQYIFRIIQSPLVPDKKSAPNRIAYIISGLFLGFIISIIRIFFYKE